MVITRIYSGRIKRACFCRSCCSCCFIACVDVELNGNDFTMDIFKRFINKNVSETKMVTVGRVTSVIALVIAVLTAKPLLGNLDQAFQYIQEFTGFVTPGVCIIFCFGLFLEACDIKCSSMDRNSDNSFIGCIFLFRPRSSIYRQNGICSIDFSRNRNIDKLNRI